MSDVERHNRLREVFDAARGLDEKDRPAFLESACADDPALRHEVERLLSHHAAAPDFLERPPLGDGFLDDGDRFDRPPAGTGRPGIAVEIGRRIADATGQYRVESVLGQGAMATVFRAEHTATGRIVAFKVVRAGLTDERLAARLQREARILGRLQHPGIADIYDAGVVDFETERQPYFAMEYVEGSSIVQHADRSRLSTADRLELLARVAEALHHAHEHGVVHRDLKPDNILVTPSGQPKILDFGVARATEADLRAATLHTAAGQLVGTVQYMSPEQAAGDVAAISPRSDVYALGVVAFELLGGRLPYDVIERPLPDALRTIRDDDPTRLGSVDTALRGDAETIVGRALEKEPGRRYASARDFADDIRRLLRDEPIRARPPTTLYQIRKFTRRNRMVVAGLALLLAVLLAATIVSLTLASIARGQRDRAQWNAYVANVVAAGSALADGGIATAKAHLDAAPTRLRRWEWFHLSREADASLMTLRGHEYWVWSVALDPSGHRAATGAGDATVRVWDLATGRLTRVLDDHDGRVFVVSWSPDGTRLASGSSDGTVRLRDGRTFETIAVLADHAERVCALAFSPDSSRLVSGGAGGRMFQWDAATGAMLGALPGHDEWVWSVAFAPDGRRFASASCDDTVRIWDVATGTATATLSGHDGDVTAVAFSPDGRLLVSGGLDGTVRVWDGVNGRPGAVLEGHEDWVGAVAFTPAGTEIVSAGNDATIRAWDAATGALLATRRGHEDCARAIAITPDGRRLVSASFDTTVKVWDATGWRAQLAPHAYEDIEGFAFEPDGRLLLRAWSGAVSLGDPCRGTRELRGNIEGDRMRVTSADGARLVITDGPDQARIVNLRSGASFRIEGLREDARFAFAPDGRRVAVSRENGEVDLIDVETERELAVLRGHRGNVTVIAFTPAGDLLATGAKDETVRIWRVESGAPVSVLDGMSQAVRGLAFTPDGRRLVVATHDRTMRLWDPIEGRILVTYPRHEAIPTAVAIDAAGSRVAAGDDGGLVRIFNLDGGETLMTLPLRPGPITKLAFSANDTLLAVQAGDRLHVLDGRPNGGGEDQPNE